MKKSTVFLPRNKFGLYMVTKGKFVMESFSRELLDEDGLGLRIGEYLYRLKSSEIVDFKDKPEYTRRKIGDTGLVLNPGETYVIETEEWVDMRGMLGTVSGYPPVSRKGIHVDTWTIPTGYKGKLLLTVTVTNKTRIYPETPIAKFMVYDLPKVDKRGRHKGHYENLHCEEEIQE